MGWNTLSKTGFSTSLADQYDWKTIFVLFLFQLSLLVTIFLSVWTALLNQSQGLENGQIEFSIVALIASIGLFLSAYLSPKGVLKGIVVYYLGYGLYCLLSYLILASQQINNSQFDVWSLAENGFLQKEHGIILLGLLVLSIAYFYSSQYFKWNIETPYQGFVKTSSLSSLFAMTFLSNERVLEVMRPAFEKQLENPSSVNLLYLLSYVSYWLCAALLLGFLCTRSIQSFVKNRTNLSLVILSSLIFGVVLNYYFQRPLNMGETLLGQFSFSGAITFQILCISLAAFSVYWILDRFLLATLINLFLGVSLSVTNELKVTLRNEPVLLTDLTWLKDFGSLLEFVEPQFIYRTMALVLFMVTVYVIGRRYLLTGRILKSKLLRWVISVVMLVSGTSFYQELKAATILDGEQKLPVVTKLARDYRIAWLGSKINASYKSLMYVWFEQLTSDIMEKPEGYSEDQIKELVTKYQDKATEINKSRTDLLSDQTLIFVLSESLANPAYVPGVSLSQPVLPQIMAIKDSTTSGLMVSNGYGGGTANMEFQSLTGLPLYNFSPTVSIAYTEVVPTMAYLPSISHFFAEQDRLVIHPASATNYNRHLIYRDLAFDKFLAHLNSDDKVEHVEVVGTQISDKTVYRNVLEQLDPSRQQFFSVLTMQNHIPWHAGEPADVVATGEGFTEEENNNLTSYARLLTVTDTETAKFLDELSTIDKKITVVFYGDHLPGIYPHSTFSSAPETQYQTDYFIWSNYQTQKLDYPLVNSSDFQALLLAHANAKVSPYQALLTEVLNKASVNQVDLSQEQEQVAIDLEMLQYDLTLGKKYILESEGFFTVD